MTRVLILGSSHVGAYKNAELAFADMYPEIELDFFGVRGPLFLGGSMDVNGVFAPAYRADQDRETAVAVNGIATADSNDYDHVLVVGHRFTLVNMAMLLEQHDILEGFRTKNPRLLSETMLAEIIEEDTDASVSSAADPFANCPVPLTFAMAPYPAESILERAPKYELARLLGHFWAHPDAGWLCDMAFDALHQALEARGYSLLEQPDALNAGPFSTKAGYAKRASGLGSDTLAKIDHRHMNADFGLAMLCAFAESHLGYPPRPRGETSVSNTLNERIA